MRAVLTTIGMACILMAGCGGSAGTSAGAGTGGDVSEGAGGGTGGDFGVGGSTVTNGSGGQTTTSASGGTAGVSTGGSAGRGTGGTGTGGVGTGGSGTGGVGTGGSSAGTGGTVAAAAASTGTIVPLYTIPSDSSWTKLAAAKAAHPRVPVIAAVNPANGPGAAATADYTSGIGKLQLAGITVIGYVRTSYAARAVADIKADIDHWKAFYPGIQGIFFDEQSKDVTDEGFYRTVSQYAKSRGLSFTVGNPGTDTAPGYIGVFDVGIIYENSGFPAIGSLAGWHTGYPKTNFCVLAYGVPTLNHALIKQARANVGYIYVDSDVLPNPWDTVPGYIADLLADLE
jgi:Spherulation-specific family 4